MHKFVQSNLSNDGHHAALEGASNEELNVVLERAR